MRTYAITITGTNPLLMHWDNIDWADEMEAWKNNPSNKRESRAGDDRSPAFRWIGSLYQDGQHVGMPNDNLMRCLMEGGAMVPVPGAKGNKTFKSQSQSGMMINEAYWPLTVGGRRIPVEGIEALMECKAFADHRAAVRDMGFDLFVKRAKVGASKHIRVRPRFDRWQIAGTLTVRDEQITEAVLRDILLYAGRYKGLGDWRPGGKTPGSFGMFTAEVTAA